MGMGRPRKGSPNFWSVISSMDKTLKTFSKDQGWDMVIGSKRNLFDLRLGELWRARDLILLFVRRDFVSIYKQTILGPLWYLIQPLHLYGTGEQSRGFTYVDDIAQGTIAALELPGYEIINLGGHEVITINALIAMIEEKIGRKALVERHPPNPADMLTNWADVSKARNLLGWQPQVGIQNGVQHLVDWYNSEREWAKGVVTL